MTDWPYAEVELYLGRRTLEATLAAPAKPDERCDRAAAIQALTAAANTCSKDFVELTEARAKLKRLGNSAHPTVRSAGQSQKPSSSEPV